MLVNFEYPADKKNLYRMWKILAFSHCITLGYWMEYGVWSQQKMDYEPSFIFIILGVTFYVITWLIAALGNITIYGWLNSSAGEHYIRRNRFVNAPFVFLEARFGNLKVPIWILFQGFMLGIQIHSI